MAGCLYCVCFHSISIILHLLPHVQETICFDIMFQIVLYVYFVLRCCTVNSFKKWLCMFAFDFLVTVYSMTLF